MGAHSYTQTGCKIKSSLPKMAPLPTFRHMARQKPRPKGTAAPPSNRTDGSPVYNVAAVAPRVLDIIASGGTWERDIHPIAGLPSQRTFWKWCQADLDLQAAYEAAQRASARIAAEKAQQMADQLARLEVPKDQIRAFEVAMGQYRWWAERADPARWGQRVPQAPAAAIQIITNALAPVAAPQTITIDAPSKRAAENARALFGEEHGREV